MFDSIKTFFADEKVQAFSLGLVTGGVIAAGTTYFFTRPSTVAAAVDTVTDKASDVVDDVKQAAEDVANNVSDTVNKNNPDEPSLS
jgi:hypothetical protein